MKLFCDNLSSQNCDSRQHKKNEQEQFLLQEWCGTLSDPDPSMLTADGEKKGKKKQSQAELWRQMACAAGADPRQWVVAVRILQCVSMCVHELCVRHMTCLETRVPAQH